MKTMRIFCTLLCCWIYLLVNLRATQFILPNSCQPGQYYEPSLMACQSCPANVSLVTSIDGFGCTCEEHSIPEGINRCKPCNATEVVSSDGRSCVPRRCQKVAGKFVCRKCPNEYISVTQNIDGSPLKEVQCLKCTRGFRAENNICVRCEACTCAKSQIIVRGICIPRSYVNSRPKYEENSLHPVALLDIVKHEYLCMQNVPRACRILASECVKNFYSTDPGGPCRLWIQSKIPAPKDLPPLTVESSLADKRPGETNLPRGKVSLIYPGFDDGHITTVNPVSLNLNQWYKICVKNFLLLAAAVDTSYGGLQFLKDINQQRFPCFLPLNIRIGQDFTHDCAMKISSKITDELNVTVSPYLYSDGNLIQIPIYIRKPDGYSVQKGTWISSKFKRYFIVDQFLSKTANITTTVYIQTMLIRLQVERDKSSQGSLKVYVSIEANYATKSPLSNTFVTSLKVMQAMPEAGVHRGLEIWGGVLGSILVFYAMIKWRGIVRRGGIYFSVAPLLAGSVADTLYFATLFSTLHALAAEAGTLGLTLPLSQAEEYTIKALIYSAVSLKSIKVAWSNFNQCRCDIFFLDWSEYNPPFKDSCTMEKSGNWRAATLGREWSRMQTMRRVSPGHTVSLVLLILHFLTPWQTYLPPSVGYKWAIATIAWWSSYITFLLARWISDRLVGSPLNDLPKICTNVGLSLLVFEEEYYAHYIHGRNDDSRELRSMAGPLAACRLVCAPQLRIIYKQLSLSISGLGESETRQALLSRFLATFFERALDGLSWVASERTILERLLDIELTTRETGNTSTLLYDSDDKTPSCFAVTWWGEEWNLSTFEAMFFGCLYIVLNDALLAGFLTLILWQTMKILRKICGNKNQRTKTETVF